MIEVYGDIWTYTANMVCITTNGAVRNDGACVMGRGVALQAKQKYPGIDFKIGAAIKQYGNHVLYIQHCDRGFFTFPVKHHWRQKADLDLIYQSCLELKSLMINFHPTTTVVLPRPGCGNGQRTWSEVKPMVAALLPDSVHVITKERDEYSS